MTVRFLGLLAGPLYPQEYSLYSFLLEAEPIPETYCDWKY
jgi:hypothetical protein